MTTNLKSAKLIHRTITSNSIPSPELNIASKENPKTNLEQLFSNRPSLLDVKQLATENEFSTNLTGFYHFYWITLTFFVISTFFTNWVDFGYLLSGKLLHSCFGDSIGVIVGELLFLVLVFISGSSIFFNITLIRKFRTIFPFGALFLGTFFGFYRDWSGLQRSIYLLHSLSVYMKIHAFLHHHRSVDVKLSMAPTKFCHLFYFVFAPTMVYSENYPKSTR